MSSQVEQAAELAKARVRTGSPLETAMSFSKGSGFYCAPFAERSEERGQPSFFCTKRIVEKRLWGLFAEYHDVLVDIDADDTDTIVSVHVRIGWGGLRGL